MNLVPLTFLMKTLSTLLFIVTVTSCLAQVIAQPKEIVITEGLSVIKLTDNVYQHISDLQTTDFGKVKCNGLIYINDKEGIICDTPVNNELSKALLEWIGQRYPQIKIKALIVNHFHADCLGGIETFHAAGITSYAHERTRELLKTKGDTLQMPEKFFSSSLKLNVGTKDVINYWVGEAHTSDNVFTWIPAEKTIFGGCMVKSMNAGKGNLADANVSAWPATIKKIKSTCPSARIVVPGHGDAGGQELLDYTIDLFK